GNRWQQGKGQSPGRHADGPPLPAVREGNAGTTGETNRRHVRSSSGGNAAKPYQTPARAAGRVRKTVFGGNSAGIGWFFQPSQRVFGWFRKPRQPIWVTHLDPPPCALYP